MSDDYKQGYRDGFKDGMEAAKQKCFLFKKKLTSLICALN